VSPSPTWSGMAERPGRRVVGVVLTVLAAAAVWAALVVPDRPDRLSPSGFLSIPVEALAVVGLALVLRGRWRRALGVVFGLAAGVLLVLRMLDLGFRQVFDRSFDPVNDWGYLGPGIGVLGDSVGRPAALAVVAGAVAVVLALLVVLPLCTLRVLRAVGRHRRGSLRAVVALGTVWAVCAATGVQLADEAPVASAGAARLGYDELRHLRADIEDRHRFAREIAADRLAGAPARRLLAGLRGKDVLLVFVESYGRVAVQGSSFSPDVDAVLDRGTRELRRAGWSARSAFVTSPTFGAGSWLAHSTLQTGLWVDSQQRYDQLLTTHHSTLSGLFDRAGWRTVFDVPAITHAWPEGEAFYGFDKLYDAGDVGYRGPRFGYATMPDQFTLAALWRHELAPPDRRNVMAEVDLVSSHHPWAPLPHLVPWSRVGDGSVFDGMPAHGQTAGEVFSDPAKVRAAYGQSVQYTWRTLVSWLRLHRDPNLVLVVLGDHQPHDYVTGPGVDHDVPVSVIAHDPAVLRRLDGWRWQDGLRPRPDAPVWRMDGFREHFLAAMGAR